MSAKSEASRASFWYLSLYNYDNPLTKVNNNLKPKFLNDPNSKTLRSHIRVMHQNSALLMSLRRSPTKYFQVIYFLHDYMFFFFKQKTAYEIGVRLVGSEMCIKRQGMCYLYLGNKCWVRRVKRVGYPFDTYLYTIMIFL